MVNQEVRIISMGEKKSSKFTKAFLHGNEHGNKNSSGSKGESSEDLSSKDTIVTSKIKLSSKKKEATTLLSLRYPVRLEKTLNEIIAARLQKDPSSKENKSSIVISILEQTLPAILEMENS